MIYENWNVMLRVHLKNPYDFWGAISYVINITSSRIVTNNKKVIISFNVYNVCVVLFTYMKSYSLQVSLGTTSSMKASSNKFLF